MKDNFVTDQVFPGLSRVTLHRGTHASRNELNALEATAWMAGEPHTNAPVCVAPSLRWLMTLLNDNAPDAPRQRLNEALPYLIGTSTYGDEARRIDIIGQWAKRWGLSLEGGPTRLQEAANRLQESARQAEAEAVRTAKQADVAATVLGVDSVAAHAAAYEDAQAAHSRSGEVRDAASTAARSMEKHIQSHDRIARDAATAAMDAALARSHARQATDSAGEEQGLWWAIVDDAVALIRELSQSEAANGPLHASLH